ncbi:hypothetical protein PLCT2_00739 [Planctomycetaceae bacterium]|nr:hypothetical protein PLCT2_00739 [Planctomycetaceae bacterium]
MSVEDDTPKSVGHIVKGVFEQDGWYDHFTERVYWILIALTPALAALGIPDQHEHAFYFGRRPAAVGFFVFFGILSIPTLLAYLFVAFRKRLAPQLWLRTAIILNGPVFALLALATRGRLDFSAFFWEGIVELAAMSTALALSGALAPLGKREVALQRVYDTYVVFLSVVVGPLGLMLVMLESWLQAAVVLLGYGFATWMFFIMFRQTTVELQDADGFGAHQILCLAALPCTIALAALLIYYRA